VVATRRYTGGHQHTRGAGRAGRQLSRVACGDAAAAAAAVLPRKCIIEIYIPVDDSSLMQREERVWREGGRVGWREGESRARERRRERETKTEKLHSTGRRPSALAVQDCLAWAHGPWQEDRASARVRSSWQEDRARARVHVDSADGPAKPRAAPQALPPPTRQMATRDPRVCRSLSDHRARGGGQSAEA
jgi:hypothetical protein